MERIEAGIIPVLGDGRFEEGLFYIEGERPIGDWVLLQTIERLRANDIPGQITLLRIFFRPNKIINKNKKYFVKSITPVFYDRPVEGTGARLRETVYVYFAEDKHLPAFFNFHPRVLMEDARRSVWKWENPGLNNMHYETYPVSAKITIPKGTLIDVNETGRFMILGRERPTTVVTIQVESIETIDFPINRTRKNFNRMSANAARKEAEIEAVNAERRRHLANAERVRAAREAAGGAGVSAPLTADPYNNAIVRFNSGGPVISNYFANPRAPATNAANAANAGAGAMGGRRHTARRHKRKATRRHKRRHTRHQ